MEEMKKYFSEADINEVKEVTQIALEGVDTKSLSNKEYTELVEMLESIVLNDLYQRRYAS